MSTIKKVQHKNKEFNVLDLDNSNIFKLEITCKMGSNLERIYKQQVQKNVYGGCHLIEHLGFKSTRDYSSSELLNNLKLYGSYNANTDFEKINYYYMTSMDNLEIGTKLITNVTFNDFKNITEEEFSKERDVVSNEVKRYHDDTQTMFWMGVNSCIYDYEKEDNILGTVDSVNNLDFRDLKVIKAFMLNPKNYEYTVTFDSSKKSLEEVLDIICSEVDSFNSIPLNMQGYEGVLTKAYNMNNQEVHSDTDQTMIAYVYEEFASPYVGRIVNNYISSFAPDVSLNDIIREKNGLTYGISFYTAYVNEKYPIMFGCDVSQGKDILLNELYHQSINAICDTFDEEKYNNFITKQKLNAAIDLLNKKSTMGYAKAPSKRYWEEVKDCFENAEETSYKLLDRATFDVMRDYLRAIKELTNSNSYKIIKGIKDGNK